jgi:peptidyl-prolyl cis-trans isomerase D
MALINKIREKTGLAVGIIAFGLILFLVGGDILGPNSVILGKNKMEVGEIAGETIDREEYVQQIEELKYNYSLNFNRNPSENEMVTIRQQAWDYLIVKKAFQKQFDILNLEVTEEELVDMVQGKNIHPDLLQAFTNPQTGQFNRDQIVTYLQNISNMPAQQQAGWYMFESNIKPSRIRLKYDNLLQKTTYVTDQEAEQQYYLENNTAEIRYLDILYYTISDILIEVTERDLEDYLEENRNSYKIDESRSINYVSFEIVPSADDTLYFRDEMQKIAREFKQLADDSIYAKINSDGNFPYGRYTIGQLPTRVRDAIDTLKKGDVIGPYLQVGNLVVNKVSDIIEDTINYARASHILVRVQGDDAAVKSEARNKANDLLRQLRNGENFAMLARNNSDDQTASAGGDLGWFDENRMVKPFSDAVFSATSEGLIPRVIETEFGFHLIQVTGLKTNKVFKIATIEREITASDITRDEAFRKADYFSSASGNLEEFERNAAKDSLVVQVAEDISKNERRITGVGDAREVVRWMYVDASLEEVSPVFELEDQYLIAVLTEIKEEGYASVDDVRDQLIPKVKNELKGDMIINKLNAIEGDLDQKSSGYGDDVRVYTNSNLKLSTNSIPSVGFAPRSVGIAFALDEGQVSEPIKENDGVVIIQLSALIRSPEIADYSTYKNQIEQRRESRTSFELSEAIKEFANIVDERYKYF